MNWWWILFIAVTLYDVMRTMVGYSQSNEEASDTIIVFSGFLVLTFRLVVVYLAIKQGF